MERLTHLAARDRGDVARDPGQVELERVGEQHAGRGLGRALGERQVAANPIAHDGAVGKPVVLDPPSQPREPIAPNRPLYLSLVLLVGLGAGAALSFLLSQLHTTYITSAQLEKRFDYPVLGSVTEIVSDNQRAQNRVWLWGFGVLSLGLIVIYLALLLYELV